MQKKVREKSRECRNHKPQSFPDTKRKRKPTTPNKHKSNKRMKSTKISSLFPKRDNHNAKRTKKTQEQNNTFARFVLVWCCWFPLPLGVWEGLRFVIVALPFLLQNIKKKKPAASSHKTTQRTNNTRTISSLCS